MNSIMQEASSLAKAVEQAWIKAGKPQKFSVRVFEEAQKNFIGMTTSPAKIALLFETKDIIRTQEQDTRKRETTKPREQHTPRYQPKRQESYSAKASKDRPSSSKDKQKNQEHQQEKVLTEATSKPKIFWTDEMVAIARNWVRDALEKIDKKDVEFTTEVKRYHLRFVLSGALENSEEKQKDIFRNFAHLIMQTVRNRQKKQFKYHKVVLTSDK